MNAETMKKLFDETARVRDHLLALAERLHKDGLRDDGSPSRKAGAEESRMRAASIRQDARRLTDAMVEALPVHLEFGDEDANYLFVAAYGPYGQVRHINEWFDRWPANALDDVRGIFWEQFAKRYPSKNVEDAESKL